MIEAILNIFIYLFQASLGFILFIGVYKLFLEHLTFFTWNRCYLMSTAMLCLLLPVADIDWFQVNDLVLVKTAQTVSDWQAGIVENTLAKPSTMQTSKSWWLIIAAIGLLYGLITFSKLYKLWADIHSVYKLIKRYPYQHYKGFRLICINDEIPTSSFLNYIFLNKAQENSPWIDTILAHEEAHCRQLHSIDYLFTKLLSAIFWFNPAMPWWQKALIDNHEYLADEKVTQNTNPSSYAMLLLEVTTPKNTLSTLHTFSYSYGQLKSRIIMLHQIRSKAINRMRFLLVFPLIALLLTFVSCEDKFENSLITSSVASSGYHFKDLVGSWSNVNRVTVNEDDGRNPRVFPQRAGSLRICSSELILNANGQFQMIDKETNQSWKGNWQSNKKGTSIELAFKEPSAAIGLNTPLSQIIALDITSLEEGKMEALQTYTVSNDWSGGQVYYEFKRQ